MSLGPRGEPRKARIARNEALFREVNERVEEMTAASASDGIDFVCECGDPECTASVPLTRAEYERVRSDPVLFAIVPGHEILDVEDVVARDERFYLVRKHVDEQDVARGLDPRS